MNQFTKGTMAVIHQVALLRSGVFVRRRANAYEGSEAKLSVN